jgi:hypothetical protein
VAAAGRAVPQHKVAAAVGAVDLALALHVQENTRVTQRAIIAIAGNNLFLNDYAIFYVHWGSPIGVL